MDERKEWYDNGQLFKQYTCNKNGKLEGERKQWHDNGQLQLQEFYRVEKLDGERKYWHENGQLGFREFYREGKLEGEFKQWNSDGQIEIQSSYRNGTAEGEYKMWYYYDPTVIHYFYMGGIRVDPNFTVHKKHNWIRRLRKFRATYNLRAIDPILKEFMPLDLVKLCVRYK